jgi:uncharacterized membrane protein
MARRHGATFVLLVVLIVGVVAIAWAVFSPTNNCFHGYDYEVCTDMTAVKWSVGIVGGMATIGAATVYWRIDARRRELPKAPL